MLRSGVAGHTGGGGGMAISRLPEQPTLLQELRSVHVSPRSPEHDRPVGHAHFWERAMSRGALVKGAVGVGGAAVTGALFMPALAHAGAATTPATPNPVPPNPALGGLHIN